MPGIINPVTNPYFDYKENVFATDPETGDDPIPTKNHSLRSLMIKRQQILKPFESMTQVVKGKDAIKMAKGLTPALINNTATAIMGARLLIQPTKMHKGQPGLLDFIPPSLKSAGKKVSGSGTKIQTKGGRSTPVTTTTNVTTSTAQ